MLDEKWLLPRFHVCLLVNIIHLSFLCGLNENTTLSGWRQRWSAPSSRRQEVRCSSTLGWFGSFQGVHFGLQVYNLQTEDGHRNTGLNCTDFTAVFELWSNWWWNKLTLSCRFSASSLCVVSLSSCARRWAVSFFRYSISLHTHTHTDDVIFEFRSRFSPLICSSVLTSADIL